MTIVIYVVWLTKFANEIHGPLFIPIRCKNINNDQLHLFALIDRRMIKPMNFTITWLDKTIFESETHRETTEQTRQLQIRYLKLVASIDASFYRYMNSWGTSIIGGE